ncbi:hypothetical protein XA26_27690 [Mycolicibacterium fortuitum]|uniref:Uncharacterized protein n=1 Tax=Mycolicibacterium fortuitum TaxID=1766 RepID=A0A0N9YAR9_MYCFO|nr:hypothetical protein XA26_27690 [Mycolicibacterium fortuitum]
MRGLRSRVPSHIGKSIVSIIAHVIALATMPLANLEQLLGGSV